MTTTQRALTRIACAVLATLTVASCGDDDAPPATCDGACVGVAAGPRADAGPGGDAGPRADAGPPVTSTILSPDRVPPPGTWESAGVEGGIPTRSTVCADVTAAPYDADRTGATSAVSAIQRAIDDCPDGQVVSVPAGTYLIDDAITMRSPITLRGVGATTVFRVETGSGTAIHIGGLGPWPPPFKSATGEMRPRGQPASATCSRQWRSHLLR